MKYALVTGASSGIGLEFAKQLDELGYSLILVARRKERLLELQKILKHESFIFDYDLAIYSNCLLLLEKIQDYPIEVVINNAGIGEVGKVVDIELEKDLEMIDLNIKAMHILSKYMAKRMKEGYILNVASSAGLLPAGPYMATYYATKSYVVSFTRALHRELKEENHKLYVGTMCPGPVNTEFNQKANVKSPLKGIEASECVAYALKKMKRKKVIIVPTLSQKLAVITSKILPANFFIPFVSYQQKKKLR